MRGRMLGWILGLAMVLGVGSQAMAATPKAGSPTGQTAAKAETDDPVQARAEVEDAARSGDPDALASLGVLTFHGVGGPKDETAGLALLERAVAAGSNVGRLNLGGMLLASEEDADQKRGFGLLQQAAKDPKIGPLAAEGLAKAYLFGLGTPRDMTKGVDQLMVAESAYPERPFALLLLGRTYQAGWGGRARDPVKAFDYFRRAAEQGDSRAKWLAAMATLQGQGTTRDPRWAWKWVKEAADDGELDGQISAAVMLATGEGVEEDDAEARRWYEKAAVQGSPHALRGLGLMLLTGEGGPVDPILGQAYLELAVEGGDEMAVELASQIGIDPTPAQRRDIDDAKAAWLKSHPMRAS